MQIFHLWPNDTEIGIKQGYKILSAIEYGLRPKQAQESLDGICSSVFSFQDTWASPNLESYKL